ncbi:unnamed protein product [Pieris brassicae]|uniref:Uncharacterized protein n=1 Tax=Pieris brassicae TaxID=7116 RepID=A0A9P0T7L8_PIEBR|nr:unnamed protein product [Pieris brassicae]
MLKIKTALSATMSDAWFTKNLQNFEWEVVQELAGNQIKTESQSSKSSSQPQPKNKDVNDLWEHFDTKLSERITNQTSLALAIIMVKKYKDEKYLDRKDDPIAYWEKRKLIMPVL